MSTLEDISASELQVEILKATHNLATFDCSFEDEMGLNEFIHEEALQYQKENLGVTYLFFHQERIVGFVTLAMSQIETRETAFRLPLKVTIKNYPALLIGRLATANEYRGRNVGKSICLWCVSTTRKLSREVGCRLVVVMTNINKVEFYSRCGFDLVPKSEKKDKKWMYLQVPQE
ncbi:MAG TPA: GNAT family N-acetyltransferase [Candidatus Bathyarchaeia archaeon]|nr:GNAT family N-acetyltransferase [Candidatus Bathyarchaeia archaeon]